MIKAKGELINRNISWIMISFDNDKINILLVNKYSKNPFLNRRMSNQYLFDIISFKLCYNNNLY